IRTTEFILVGLPHVVGMVRVMYASVFLLYLFCLMGNGLIIMMVIRDCHLQKPMYFFLSNLSLKDIGHTTTFMPKLLFNYVSSNNSICFYCCLIQLFFYFLFGVTEFFIITFISLDRYLAICHPLRHSTIMTSRILKIAKLPYCTSNIINHFYFLIMSSLVFILISYLFILHTILQISSTSRQQKAFSTCASHLVVVCILYGLVFYVYLRPTVKNSSFSTMKSVSILYTIVTPVLNPFIYTIRNNEVKNSVCKMLGRKIPVP
uniref:G-protein coupled receptors family 1 profile domain-containing protein n=1 Tax=Laticauda laticaudata TaxID=8630 RepID=A0A8C5RCA5_LATLA